jgi:hypothetical protein
VRACHRAGIEADANQGRGMGAACVPANETSAGWAEWLAYHTRDKNMQGENTMTAIKIERTKITFTNAEDGLRSEVSETASGAYSVRLYDTDANEYVPVINRYNRRVDAIAYARRLVE